MQCIWEWLSLARPVLVEPCLAEPSRAEPSCGNTKCGMLGVGLSKASCCRLLCHLQTVRELLSSLPHRHASLPDCLLFRQALDLGQRQEVLHFWHAQAQPGRTERYQTHTNKNAVAAHARGHLGDFGPYRFYSR